MHLFLLSLSLLVSSIVAHDPLHDPVTIDIYYYSSKETLRRIIDAIHAREKGAYLRFSKKTLEVAQNRAQIYAPEMQQELQEAMKLNGNNIFRSFRYGCKGRDVHLANNLDLKQMTADCKQQARDYAPYWGGKLQSLYDYDALLTPAYNDHDVHFIFRFLQRIKDTPQVLFLSDQKYSEQTRNALFGNKHTCVHLPSCSTIHDLDTLEAQCRSLVGNSTYTVIFHRLGYIGAILTKRLVHSGQNIFMLDIGPLIDLIEGTYKSEMCNIQPLKKMLSREIKIVCSTALLREKAEIRKNEYLKSIRILQEYGYDPYIIEATGQVPSYFESCCRNVFHSNVNNTAIQNKGVNEGRSMLQGLQHFKFNDEDLIVKLTGRYFFKSDTFLRIVESFSEYDGLVTLDPRKFFSFSGCFGLKARYLKEMLQTADFIRMSREVIYMESVVLDFMKKIEKERNAKILYLDEVDIKAHVGHYLDYDW